MGEGSEGVLGRGGYPLLLLRGRWPLTDQFLACHLLRGLSGPRARRAAVQMSYWLSCLVWFGKLQRRIKAVIEIPRLYIDLKMTGSLGKVLQEPNASQSRSLKACGRSRRLFLQLDVWIARNCLGKGQPHHLGMRRHLLSRYFKRRRWNLSPSDACYTMRQSAPIVWRVIASDALRDDLMLEPFLVS